METAVSVNNNVRSTTSDEYIYDLYAVCNHFGNLQGGHYTGKLCSTFKFIHIHRVSKIYIQGGPKKPDCFLKV